jgi:phosphoribosylpyrophosphate synthetase
MRTIYFIFLPESFRDSYQTFIEPVNEVHLHLYVQALMTAGAKDVSAYVTHPVFPNDSWKQFLHSEGTDSGVKFQNFWITDSIPHAVEIAKHHPFRLLSLGSVIADALLSYDLRYV